MAKTAHLRLEPRPHERDLAAGFSAVLHDPVWFLARQWQMGEHQGENASSPVWVEYGLRHRRIVAADPRSDPLRLPAEAIVESERDDWWTMGRRVRIGLTFAATVSDADLLLRRPPPPYEEFEGVPDGLLVWRARGRLGLGPESFPVEVPEESTPVWDSEQLVYEQTPSTTFAIDGQPLTVRRHRGGRLDWHSVDAGPPADPLPEAEPRVAIPSPFTYPGAPSTRWWQIENAEVDFGGYPPDSAHTVTALLTDLVFSHSDDWFVFPVLARAGHAVAVDSVIVTDSFGRTYDDAAWPGLRPPEGWTLFAVDPLEPGAPALGAEELVLWHVAEQPLESASLEQVQLGFDEQANLLWAVERRVDGRDVHLRNPQPHDDDGPRFNEGTPAGDARRPTEYAYVAAQGIEPWWTPYTLNEDEDAPRLLVQRRLVDLTRQRPTTMPAPLAQVLQPDVGAREHRIAPLAVPSNGIELTRSWSLARDVDGLPVLWLQRQRRPLLAPPARRLRFDVMEELHLLDSG